MTRQQLEVWLCGGGTTPTADEIARILGAPPGRVARRLAVVRFTVAVLRDVYADDGEVRGWLLRPRGELGGQCALDVLRAGEPAAVEDLAVREWHRGAEAAA